HRGKAGFRAECLELDGCTTRADNRKELHKNCEEALNLFLEEPNVSKIVFPLPNDSLDDERDTIKIQVDLEIALAVLLRNYRINSNMTQKQAAKMLGMKNMYSYQRLEKRSNPTLNIINRIHAIFPEIELNYLFQ
ncbi:MAG: helix-turn-helix domain-containing protein, partial [Spirochaetales bacterium]|nr:helix-turn-helix domain-containing protein [Spirochaetales bacterium]